MPFQETAKRSVVILVQLDKSLKHAGFVIVIPRHILQRMTPAFAETVILPECYVCRELADSLIAC